MALSQAPARRGLCSICGRNEHPHDDAVEYRPLPAPGLLVDHLVTLHRMPRPVVEAAEPEERESWHLAEHRTRTPSARESHHAGHLDHSHDPALAQQVAA